MMLNTISSKAWEELRQGYPEAWAFLVHESLKGELKNLQREMNPNDWQKARLKELTDLFVDLYELVKAMSSDRQVEIPVSKH